MQNTLTGYRDQDRNCRIAILFIGLQSLLSELRDHRKKFRFLSDSLSTIGKLYRLIHAISKNT